MECKKYASVSEAKSYFMDNRCEHPFQRYEILCLLDGMAYKVKTKGSVAVYTVTKDNRTILIAPFRLIKKKAFVLGGEETFEYVDFIYGTDDFTEMKGAVDILFEAMRAEGIYSICWQHLCKESISFQLMSMYPIQEIAGGCNVMIPLEFDSYEDYVKSLSKHTRQNIRTAYNRLSKAGMQGSISILSGRGDRKLFQQTLRKCNAIYDQRQRKQYGHTSILQYIWRKKGTYISRAESSLARFVAVYSIDGNVAGYMHGFVNEPKRTVEIPRLAIDDAYSFYSPGVLLICETAKYLIEEMGYSGLDLCRGTEKYKYDMGGKEIPMFSFTLDL